MTTLLLDIGNTLAKYACLPDQLDKSLNVQSAPYVADQFAFLSKVPVPNKVYVACVVESAWIWLNERVANLWPDVRIERVHTPAAWGSWRNAYLETSQLGVDRFLSMIAAQQCYPQQSILLLQCGTAFCIDVLQASGQHLGGYLLPGLQRLQSWMGEWLKFWEDSCAEAIDSALPLGRSTAQNVQYGALRAARALVIDLVQEYLAREPKTGLLITGGYAEHLLQVLPEVFAQQFQVHPHLVLAGLGRLVRDKRTDLF
jgi:type III pantothenate kinase